MTANIQLHIENIEEIAHSVFHCLKPMIDSYVGKIKLNNSKAKGFLTRQETLDFFGISDPTLNKMVAEGILQKHSVPGFRGVHYKESEVLGVLDNSQLK